MSFSSIPFLCFFLPITLIIYYLCPKKRKNLVLAIASLAFFAFGEPKFVFVPLIFAAITYFCAYNIEKHRKTKRLCKLLCALSVCLNIALLLALKFKGSIPVDDSSSRLEILGISFFTLRAVSYTVDVYIGKIKAQKNIVDFFCYMIMFPLIIAGPIVRYEDIADDLSNRTLSLSKCGEGVGDFIKGLSKKVILADNIGILWSQTKLSDYSDLSALGAWLGIIAFAFQIYYSFSGYSDMAIGLGKMLGFTFKNNFAMPFSSKSISEFWGKWHITLGTWLKDYIYLPLGADKKGKIRCYLNIITVWLAAAIWHGASLNYLLWGFYFALLMIIERPLGTKISQKIPKALSVVGTNVLVLLGFLLFELETPENAWQYFCAMLGSNHIFIDNGTVYALRIYALTLLICFAFLSFAYLRCVQYVRSNKKMNTAVLAITPLVQMALLIICMAYLVNNPQNPFLYM